MNHQTVPVSLAERSYDIQIASNTFAVDSAIWQNVFSSLKPFNHAVVISDAGVRQTIGTSILALLEQRNIRLDSVVVPSGEASKCTEQLEKLWTAMLRCKTDRKSVVFAVGGGVVGDLAGFAAATFARGLRFVQVPTTLLAMVDSSVGGKTGINLPEAKNIVGAFWQPSAVVIDTDTLQTLPEREYLSGLAEVIKYGVIMRAEFFAQLESVTEELCRRDLGTLKNVIAESCRCKAEVVRQDERETTGLRAILNYGHTFAHAIEATSGYGALLHGEAVSIGMAMAGQLAVYLEMFDPDSLARQNRLLSNVGLPTDYSNYCLETLWNAMQSDKKVEQGKLGFILPTRLGEVKRVEGISFSQVQAALRT